ncbi:phage tail-collar fiber domain-containing protein [Aliivibrio salmonicida]|uniref:phage tail-collar fiber domain-containing protein n=1 Tax=Aliivibrio salmonicida TaxID=40269 RepID=UPI00406C5BE8
MVEKYSNQTIVAEPLTTAVLTDLGKRLLDEAYQSGNKLIITEMSLGDSNLSYVKPDPAFTQLVHEFGRQVINEGNTQETWINAIVYVDAKRWKGHSIFEFGLYDADGNLIVYSSYPPTTIPDDGSEYVQIEY